jgi:DnaJ-class molecular chaperone
MYVITNVIVPSKLNRKQKELFRELADTDLDNESEFKDYEKILRKN